MARTEKRAGTIGSLVRGLSLMLELGTLLGAAALVLIVLAALSKECEIALALGLGLAGVLETRRAARRGRDPRYEVIRDCLAREAALGRLQCLCAATIIAVAIAVPSWPPAVFGAMVSLWMLRRTFRTARATAAMEATRGVSRATAAEDCDVVEAVAAGAAAVPLVPQARCITKLAHLEVNAGQLGIIPGLFVATALAVLFCFISVAVAVIYREATSGRSPIATQDDQRPRKPPPSEGLARPKPTYAESCPGIPDPLAIGHRLGSLFRRDGQIKAGCGQEAFRVPETAVWVADGLCGRELRSVGIAKPGKEPVLLYGAAARFAWRSAKSGALAGAEAAEPGGGDVDLVETLTGTTGFFRSHRSATAENKKAGTCGEASGMAEPFSILPPQLMILWKDLLRERRAWSWPVKASRGRDSDFVFSGWPSGELVASGTCDSAGHCSLNVDGETWPGRGTSYVSLTEIQPYIPPPEDAAP